MNKLSLVPEPFYLAALEKCSESNMIRGHSTDHKHGKVIGTSCKRQYSPQFTAFTHNNDDIYKTE